MPHFDFRVFTDAFLFYPRRPDLFHRALRRRRHWFRIGHPGLPLLAMIVGLDAGKQSLLILSTLLYIYMVARWHAHVDVRRLIIMAVVAAIGIPIGLFLYGHLHRHVGAHDTRRVRRPRRVSQSFATLARPKAPPLARQRAAGRRRHLPRRLHHRRADPDHLRRPDPPPQIDISRNSLPALDFPQYHSRNCLDCAARMGAANLASGASGPPRSWSPAWSSATAFIMPSTTALFAAPSTLPSS